MIHITLFISLFFFIVIQPVHAMEDEKKLSLEEYRKSPRILNYAKKEAATYQTPTVIVTTSSCSTTDYTPDSFPIQPHTQQTDNTTINAHPLQRSEKHRKNLTQSNKELTRSKTADSYTASATTHYVSNSSKELSRSKSHEPSSPKPSPKISPKTTPRKLSGENSRKASPKRSPRELTIINNSDVLAFTDNNNTITTVILSDLPNPPKLPQHSRSHNSEEHSHKQQDNIVHKRSTKSKSTNDKPSNNTTISSSSSAPKEEKNNNKPVLSVSDSVVDNPTNPAKTKIPNIAINNSNNTNSNNAPLSTRSLRDSSLGKLFSKSSGTSENKSSTSLTKNSKNAVPKKNNLISLVRCTDMDTESHLKLIKECMDNADTNINKQTKLGMTALHFAALNKRRDIVDLLLLDSSLDSTIKNYNEKPQTASELIEGIDSCAEMRKPLFARLTLDTNVMQETFIMLMKSHINNQPISDKCIQETREIIKDKIARTKISQGSSQLPKNAQLPLYATDHFIEEMINCRMRTLLDSKTTQNLIIAIHEEIQKLLSGTIVINNTAIYESVITIQNNFSEDSSQKKSNKKLILPHYATYQFIYNVIHSFIAKSLLINLAEREAHAIVNFSYSKSVTEDILEEAVILVRKAMRTSGQLYDYETDAYITELITSSIQKLQEQKLTSASNISPQLSNVSLRSSIDDKK